MLLDFDSYTVASDGTFSANIPAYNAVAIHTGALGTGVPSTTTVSVTFDETATTTYGEV